MSENIEQVGDYTIRTTRVTPPSSWGQLHMEVSRDGKVIAEWGRNYSCPMHRIIHQDGKDYLLISENYHGGYGCIDLTTGEKRSYDPKYDENAENGGFGVIFGGGRREFWCWAHISGHDPERKELTVSGCFWACPYEISVYDISDPMSLPYRLISREDEPYEDDEEASAPDTQDMG